MRRAVLVMGPKPIERSTPHAERLLDTLDDVVWESAAAVIDAVAGAIGESDCEELHKGDLVQPVNALSSLAYVGVGIAIAVQALRTGRTVARSLVYAACLSAVGLGSVMFHGPQPDGSRVMHDLPILVTVLFIVNHDLHLVLRRPRHELTTFVAAALAATVLTLVSLDAGIAATGVGVAAIAVLEFVVYRRHLRPIETRRQRWAYAAIIAIAALAAASWLLGRTGSPACDPDGVFQFHGLWHAVSSLVFGLWWWLALDHPSGSATDDASSAG